ncbi:MAG: NAD(P)H-dependent oxidoreductase [Alphaproteobacteria bacterium]|nr:NAD(P)H-dependent oxidoreductase [Alphaproteobacteria bacterium]
MHILAVLAHPSRTSFAAKVFTTAIEALTEAGHDVRTLDLYGEGFEARLSEPEWRVNSDESRNRATVEGFVVDLLWADGLLLVFPTWWSGVPAILKGWLDRVFLPGVAFELRPGPFRPMLTRLKLFAAITTCGASRWQTLALFDPVRVYLRAMRLAVAPQAKPAFMRLHRMDTTSQEERVQFLEHVRERFRKLG